MKDSIRFAAIIVSLVGLCLWVLNILPNTLWNIAWILPGALAINFQPKTVPVLVEAEHGNADLR